MSVDPYQLMVQRKAINAGEAPESVQQWPEIDIKRLEEFCRAHGIVGFNVGKVPPIVALRLLKNKLGIFDEANEVKTQPKKQIIYG